jgi:hypothetical protein
MNPEALLSLISNLYAQLAAAQEEIARLSKPTKQASPVTPAKED